MKLAFRELGSGTPLLILHGLFGQSDNWNTLAKSFSEKGFRVFTIDLRNHGLSPHSEEWNYEVMADDINEFIDEHQLKDPILLGHSLGGKVVLFFEFKFKGLASKLIIADMSARYYKPHHQKVIEALLAVDFSKIKIRKEVEIILNAHIQDFGTKQFLLKNLYWKMPDQLDWRFNLDTISRKIEEIGAEVPAFHSETKTLVIRGEKSDYVLEKDLEDFSQRFSNLHIETIAGAAHWLHAEKPKEFFEVVMRFTTT